MRNLLFLLIISLLPSMMQAQQTNLDAERIIVSARIDSLLLKFMQASTLKKSGETKRSDIVCKEFRRLFIEEKTKVYDDINPVFNESNKNFPYELKVKSFWDYYDGLIEEFPNGLLINYVRVNSNYQEFNEGTVTVALERKIDGVKNTRHHFFNEDTIKLTLTISPLDKSVKISDVALIGTGSKFRVLNDKDLDNVVDEEDKCKDISGKVALNGCPDKDNDLVPDAEDECPDLAGPKDNRGCPQTTFAYSFVFSGFVGFQLHLNTISETPGEGIKNNPLKQESVNGFDVGDMKQDVSSPGINGSVTLGANVAYYFGKKKNNRNKGISIGFWATQYSAEYNFSNVKYFFKSNDSQNDYWRILNVKSAQEELTFSIINVPILFKYKQRIKKWGLEFGAGPSFISFINTTKANADFSVEGIYPGNANGLTFTDGSYTRSEFDLFITEVDVESHLFNPDYGTLSSMLTASSSSYDFGSNHFTSSEGDVDSRSGLAFNGNVDLFYHLTPKMAAKVGFSFVLTSLSGGNNNYEMIERTSENTYIYHSIYDSKIPSTYTSFGLNFGIILGI